MNTIYQITNPIGQRYIGSTSNLKGRVASHKYSLKRGKSLLIDSFKEHGFDNHKFEILVKETKENAFQTEHCIIRILRPELNQVVKYNATQLGKTFKMSDEQKQKISVAHTGKILAPEHKEKVLKGLKKATERNSELNSLQVKDLISGKIWKNKYEAMEDLGLSKSAIKRRIWVNKEIQGKHLIFIKH